MAKMAICPSDSLSLLDRAAAVHVLEALEARELLAAGSVITSAELACMPRLSPEQAAAAITRGGQ